MKLIARSALSVASRYRYRIPVGSWQIPIVMDDGNGGKEGFETPSGMSSWTAVLLEAARMLASLGYTELAPSPHARAVPTSMATSPPGRPKGNLWCEK